MCEGSRLSKVQQIIRGQQVLILDRTVVVRWRIFREHKNRGTKFQYEIATNSLITRQQENSLIQLNFTSLGKVNFTL